MVHIYIHTQRNILLLDIFFIYMSNVIPAPVLPSRIPLSVLLHLPLYHCGDAPMGCMFPHILVAIWPNCCSPSHLTPILSHFSHDTPSHPVPSLHLSSISIPFPFPMETHHPHLYPSSYPTSLGLWTEAVDLKLFTSTYFLSSHLAFCDLWYSMEIRPKMLVVFFS